MQNTCNCQQNCIALCQSWVLYDMKQLPKGCKGLEGGLVSF